VAPTTIAVALLDVNGDPVSGAASYTLKSDAGPPTTAVLVPPPASFSIPAGTTTLTLEVDHPDYARESVEFEFTSSAVNCRSRICNWSLGSSPSALTATVSVGRVRRAPCAFYPLANRALGDQSGVILSKEFPQYNGFSILLRREKFRFLRDGVVGAGSPSGPSVIANINHDAWERFWFVEREIDISDRRVGAFLWLEYGAVGSAPSVSDPRFLIAMWAPPASTPIPPEGLDYIVFYSPTTAIAAYPPARHPFRTNYPYIVRPGSVDQPYVDLAYRYILDGRFFAQSLVASGKPCILLMPIFPNCIQTPDDQFQPFDSQAGTYRLLREVARFLHREGYGVTPNLLDTWNGRECAGASKLTILPASPTPAPIPPIRNVALAGYSNSSACLARVLNQGGVRNPRHYPPVHFEAPASAFQGPWREIWGLDLLLSQSLGIFTDARRFQTDLLHWQTAPRAIRLYMSGVTTANARPGTYFGEFAKLGLTQIQRTATTDSATWAEEWRSGNTPPAIEIVTTSQAALHARAAAIRVLPQFPSSSDDTGVVHAFMASIAFGHATSQRIAW
jgi:hypothetical protein